MIATGNTWIISDTHFLHRNLFEKYEPVRQAWGKTVEEMTDFMVAGWNARVAPTDSVLHLGDWAMGKTEGWPALRARLAGNITLIQGNHDRKVEKWLIPGRDTVQDVLEIQHHTLGLLILRHDPHRFTQDEGERATLLLHGHLHSGNHRADTPEPIRHKCVCLSVERLPGGPYPIPLEEVSALHALQHT